MNVQCLLCPLCGGPPSPFLPFNPEHAFCATPECSVNCWNPSRTLNENIMDARSHVLPDWLSGEKQ